jgi:ADP-ribose pyrophosphatase YjhB (NUDIX family)
VLLFDTTGHVLLVRFVVARAGEQFAFWATPGGEVEDGETLDQAARRELLEELGLTADLAGPVHKVRSEFEHEGRQVANTDTFFAGKLSGDMPALSGVTPAERSAMRSLRWWSADEIERSEDTFFPPGLAELIRRLADFAVGSR